MLIRALHQLPEKEKTIRLMKWMAQKHKSTTGISRGALTKHVTSSKFGRNRRKPLFPKMGQRRGMSHPNDTVCSSGQTSKLRFTTYGLLSNQRYFQGESEYRNEGEAHLMSFLPHCSQTAIESSQRTTDKAELKVTP